MYTRIVGCLIAVSMLLITGCEKVEPNTLCLVFKTLGARKAIAEGEKSGGKEAKEKAEDNTPPETFAVDLLRRGRAPRSANAVGERSTTLPAPIGGTHAGTQSRCGPAR